MNYKHSLSGYPHVGKHLLVENEDNKLLMIYLIKEVLKSER